MAVGGSRATRRFLVDDCNVEVRSDNFASLLTKGDMFPVVNLSLGGVQFVAFRLLTIGQRLKLNIKVGDQFGFIKTPAVVRWVDQIPGERACRVGAGFVKLPDDVAAKLRKMENDYWPRQQDIQEGGLERLKLPASVARKLSFMIDRGHETRPDRETVLLMRKGFKTPKMGDISDLTQQQVGYGRWIDRQRGLVFKNPEESLGDRMAEAHSRDGPPGQSVLDPTPAEPPEQPAGAPPVEPAPPEEDRGQEALAKAADRPAAPALPLAPGSPDSPAPGLEIVSAEPVSLPIPVPAGSVDAPPAGPQSVFAPSDESPLPAPAEPVEGLPADLDVAPATVDAPSSGLDPIVPVTLDLSPVPAAPEAIEPPPAEPEEISARLEEPSIPALAEPVDALPDELEVIPAEVGKTPISLAAVPADAPAIEAEPIPAEIGESAMSALGQTGDLVPPESGAIPEAVVQLPSDEAEAAPPMTEDAVTQTPSEPLADESQVSAGDRTPLPALGGTIPTPVPKPQPERETLAHDLHPIPLHLLGGKHKLSVDEEGLPSGPCASTLSLPGLGLGHFAIRVVDASMTSANGKSFRLGDIVVFSTDTTAKDAAYALVATEEGPLFRQVFYAPESRVTLHPLNPGHPDTELDPDEIVAMWPSVAHICWK